MRNIFEVAYGSVIGKEHRRCSKNNQDALHLLFGDNYLITIVCDGCGSQIHSETGAKIGSRLIVKLISDQLRQIPIRPEHGLLDFSPVLERVRQNILAELGVLANWMGDSLTEVVSNYFLFTTVGAILLPGQAVFFSIGDGVIIINDEIITLGPFPENRPPYLVHNLLDLEPDSKSLRFQIIRSLSMDEVNSFLVGTDGVCDLVEASELCLPGKTEEVGPINQFWENDRYFSNRDNVRRRLTLVNREVRRYDRKGRTITRENGHLPDDTTLIVGRKCQTGGG